MEKIKENLAKTRISVQDIDGCDFQLYAKEHPNILANLAGREVKHGSYGEGEIEKIIPHDDGRIHVVVRFFENGIKTLGSFIYLFTLLLTEKDSENFIKWKEKQEGEGRRKIEEEKLIKLGLIAKLKTKLREDYLSADDYYKKECSEIITYNEYDADKISFIKSWTSKNTSTELDDEQAKAVGEYHTNIQLVARAGSGKTTTLINRAAFLQKHCGIPPNQILLLAFNRKAAEEISERIRKVTKGQPSPHAMTFHALAYRIVHPEETPLFDDSKGENQSLSRNVQSVIDDHLRNPNYYRQIRKLMLTHFSEDWEKIVKGHYDKTQEEFLKLHRSFASESLKGDYVKSYGEKIIANFLYEHNIPYRYERNHCWSGINYRPDFTIFKSEKPPSGIIIEYFGMEGEPEYDKLSGQKKIYWEGKKNWKLLEYTPKDLNRDGANSLMQSLKKDLMDEGFPCKKLSEDEIWNLVRHRAIDRFTKATVGFISRCRKLVMTSAELGKKITSHCKHPNIEKQFLQIANIIYAAYLDLLRNTGQEDFDGLMQNAVHAIEEGTTKFHSRDESGDLKNLRYIFIDEFQDFSLLFMRLISAIRKINGNIELFCVGDDWQAINGFAGSDLKYFNYFSDYFDPSKRLYISGNYRSDKSIVKIGNKIMDEQDGPPAIAKKSTTGDVFLVDLDEFKPSLVEQQRHSGDTITPALLRLIDQTIKNENSIILLSRTNEINWVYIDFGKQYKTKGRGLERYLKLIRSFFPEDMKARISISTAHKYKGLEKSVVIVLDALERNYPFLHPNWVFNQILGDTKEKIVEEERRLFYVALTRAINKLFIVTIGSQKTPFLTNFVQNPVNWERFPPIKKNNYHLIVKIKSQKGKGVNPTIEIKDFLKANNYQWNSVGRCWEKTFLVTSFKLNDLQKELWVGTAKGIEVTILDEQNSLLAKYYVNSGNWEKDFDNIPITDNIPNTS